MHLENLLYFVNHQFYLPGILICGSCDAGKTTLLGQLLQGKPLETYTSMKVKKRRRSRWIRVHDNSFFQAFEISRLTEWWLKDWTVRVYIFSKNNPLLLFKIFFFHQMLEFFNIFLIYPGMRLYKYNEDDFLKFWLLTIFFRFTSLQVIKEKLFQLTASYDFYVYVNPCCFKAWYKSKLKSKVVFILLIHWTMTVYIGEQWCAGVRWEETCQYCWYPRPWKD